MKDACPDIESLLAEFAAEELEAADAERVAGHLAGCTDCRAELDRELRLRGLLASLPVQAGPVVPTAAASAPSRRRERRRWWPLTGGLVAAAVALVLLLPGTRNVATDGDPDVATIRRDARTSLALAARILEKSERHTVVDVFGRQLPAAIRGTLPAAAVTPEGGQG